MNTRSICPNCEYILERCLCSTLKPIDNKTQLIILQHQSESNHALNTVNIMKKSFLQMDLFIGEDFSDHQELNVIIEKHKETIGVIFPVEKMILLNSESGKKITHLIFIDGTWKKARKIYLLSKNLHHLDIYFLKSEKDSQYQIRSSHLEHSLSTLEAVVFALSCIEYKLDTKSLQDSFLKMIQIQIEKMGEETFKANYKKNE